MNPQSSPFWSWAGAGLRRLGRHRLTPWLITGAGAAAATATAMQWPGDRPVAPVHTATADTADPVRRSTVRYRLSPELRLQRADGGTLPLQQALFDGRPVVLSFMYSSCATV